MLCGPSGRAGATLPSLRRVAVIPTKQRPVPLDIATKILVSVDPQC